MGADGSQFGVIEGPQPIGTTVECVACHDSGTYGVPAPAGSSEVETLRNYYTPTGPASAACLLPTLPQSISLGLIIRVGRVA